MTWGHSTVADGWAGVSNPHPHSTPPLHTNMHKKYLKRLFFHFSTRSPRTGRLIDGQSPLKTCLSATKKTEFFFAMKWQKSFSTNQWTDQNKPYNFTHSSIHSSTHQSIHSSTLSLTHQLIHSSSHRLIHSSTDSSAHSSCHQSIHS